jgi:hypothetical protein
MYIFRQDSHRNTPRSYVGMRSRNGRTVVILACENQFTAPTLYDSSNIILHNGDRQLLAESNHIAPFQMSVLQSQNPYYASEV